jgi:predicted Zn-dependent peptidase
MRRLTLALAGALALLAPVVAAAQKPAPIRFERYTLDNGLEVLLAEDHSAQVVAVDVWYDVGSRDERPGLTGFAHLFEHMMFQGSANVKKAEHFQLIERAGGMMNGSTADDRTNYWQVLPSNRLNLGLWLEADRMRSLAVTAENLKNQQEAVKEERRLRIDNQPYATAFVEGLPQAFDSTTCFGYAHPGIGSMADLNAAKIADVQAFFRTYYAPNNARLVVVGDFEPAAAKALIRQYFSDIPRQPQPPAPTCTGQFNRGARRLRVPDAKATLPAAIVAYLMPETGHADAPALQLLGVILGQGESSRLNRVLAREQKAVVATQALAGLGPRRGPGLFVGFGIANQGVSIDTVEALLVAEFQRLAREGVTAAELEKARNAYRASTIGERQQVLNVAEVLHTAATFYGAPDAVNTAFDRVMAVTLDDIKRVAATYFRPDNSFTLLVVPEVAQ